MSVSESNSQARKRARKDAGDTEATEPDMIRSPDFYFNDGTIILRTSAKENIYTLYRVHKSVLALHCTVFRDMFGDKDTEYLNNASEQYDGVSLMQLYDECGDVENFLRALYQPEFMHRHTNLGRYDLDTCDFPEMYSGAMRLAKKYGAEKLVDVFADALRQAWPSDWKRHTAVMQSRAAEVENREDIELDSVRSHDFYPNPAWTIKMAVDLDIPDVLPCAFAALCARLGPGMNVTDTGGQGKILDEMESGISVLKAEELLCVIIGGRHLSSYIYEHVSEYVPPGRGTFRVPEDNEHTCYSHFVTSWMKFAGALEKAFGASNPFRELSDALDDTDLCRSCCQDARNHINEIERDIWMKLPVLFQLQQYGVKDDWGC